MSEEKSKMQDPFGHAKDIVKDIKKKAKNSFIIYVVLVFLTFLTAICAQIFEFEFLFTESPEYFTTALDYLGSSAVVASMIMVYANSFWKNDAILVIKGIFQRKQHNFVTLVFVIYLAAVPAALCFYGLELYPFAMFCVYTNLLTLVYLGYLLLMVGNVLATGKMFVDDLTDCIETRDSNELIELINSAFKNKEMQKVKSIYIDIVRSGMYLLIENICSGLVSLISQTNRERQMVKQYEEFISVDDIPLECLVLFTYYYFGASNASVNVDIEKVKKACFEILKQKSEGTFQRVFWLLSVLTLMQKKYSGIFDILELSEQKDYNEFSPHSDEECIRVLREFVNLENDNIINLLELVYRNYSVNTNKIDSSEMIDILKSWAIEMKLLPCNKTQIGTLDCIANSDVTFLFKESK